MNIAGAFVEELLVPKQCLVELPTELNARAAALAEPAATVLHAFALVGRTMPLGRARVLVIGAGAIGLLAALHVRSYGCVPTMMEANPLRRQRAHQATGIEIFAAQQQPPAEAGSDLVFDAVGSAASRSLALHAVAPGGTVIHVGLADWASEIDMRKLTITKLIRVAMLMPTLLLVALLVRSRETGLARRAPPLPWFAVAFGILVLVNSSGLVPTTVQALAGTASQAALVVAIAGVGLKTSLRELAILGWRPVLLLVLHGVAGRDRRRLPSIQRLTNGVQT